MKWVRVVTSFVLLQGSSFAFCAERFLQILHVNDIHSFWENDEEGGGGLARVKTLLDQLQKDGELRGWQTIRLDAGDFSDGNLNFLANRGVNSFKIEKALHFDAVALGNHDYLTGLFDLMGRYGDSDQRLPLLASNFSSLHETGIQPGTVIYRDGIKIAIVGATLKSSIYNWAAWPATFSEPSQFADAWLATQKADVQIALTHIGLDQDRGLVSKSSFIDVVIGGHSHTVLDQPEYVLNASHRLIPIAQAGAHGSYVGRMVLRVGEESRPEIADYALESVTSTVREDPQIKKLVVEGKKKLEKDSPENLAEVVATAEDDYPTQIGEIPAIGNFLGDAMRDATNAEIALDSGYLYGDRIRQGLVTVRDIYSLAPHTYNWESEGWHIFTCDALPLSLRAALVWLGSTNYDSIVVSGMDIVLDRHHHLPRKITVDGRPMNYLKRYKTAFSEGFMEALVAGRPYLAKLLCANLRDTGILLRDALLQRARRLKVFSDDTLGNPRVHFWHH